MNEILLRAMAYDPFDRYKNANELGAALRELASSLQSSMGPK